MKKLFLVLLMIVLVGCATFPDSNKDDLRISKILLSSKEPEEYNDYKRQKIFVQGEVFWMYAEVINLTIRHIDEGDIINVIGYITIKDMNDNVIASGLVLDYEGFVTLRPNPGEIFFIQRLYIPDETIPGKYIVQFEIIDDFNYNSAVAITILKVKRKIVSI